MLPFKVLVLEVPILSELGLSIKGAHKRGVKTGEVGTHRGVNFRGMLVLEWSAGFKGRLREVERMFLSARNSYPKMGVSIKELLVLEN